MNKPCPVSAVIGDYRVTELSFAAPPAPGFVQVAQLDPTRVAIMFAVPKSQTAGATFTTTSTTNGQVGFSMEPGAAPETLRWRDVASLVNLAWNAIGEGGAPTTVTVWLVQYMPQE